MSTAEIKRHGDLTVDQKPDVDDLGSVDEKQPKDPQGASTESYVPKKEEVSIEEYLERLDHTLKGLPGLSDAITHVSALSSRGGNIPTNHFFRTLWEFMEKQQPLRDEVGVGIGIVRWRLEQLLNPDFAPEDLRFGTGIRGREIAEGGMGAVHQVALRGRPRAAKELLDPDNPEMLSRFIKEQEALQLLDGEIGPQFDGVEVVNGKRHIVMEWIDGKTLADLVEQFDGKVPPEKAYGALASFAAAIANLNEKFKIYHRDIKPKNIMINRRTGEVKIIDFGIMARQRAEQRHYNEQSTMHGAAMGTPAFMCQEQFDDSAALHPKNETFAIGATAYYVLTGQYPCPGLPSERRKWDGSVDLTQLPEDESLRQWIGSLMAKDREQRLSIHDAGRFAFERSEHFEKFDGDWEAFLAANNARRSIDPTLIRGESAIANGNDKSPHTHSKMKLKALVEDEIFWTGKKKVVTGVSTAALLAFVSLLYGLRGNNEEIPDPNKDEKKDGSGQALKKNRERKSFPKNAMTPAEFSRDENGLWSTTIRISADDSTPGSPKWSHAIVIPAEFGVQLLDAEKKSVGRLYQLTKEDCLFLQGLKKGEEKKLFQPFRIGDGTLVWEYHFPVDGKDSFETYMKVGGVGDFIVGSNTVFRTHEESANFPIMKSFSDQVDFNMRGASEEFKDFWDGRILPKISIRFPEKSVSKYFPKGPIHNLVDSYGISASENIKMVKKLKEGAFLDQGLDRRHQGTKFAAENGDNEKLTLQYLLAHQPHVTERHHAVVGAPKDIRRDRS